MRLHVSLIDYPFFYQFVASTCIFLAFGDILDLVLWEILTKRRI